MTRPLGPGVPVVITAGDSKGMRGRIVGPGIIPFDGIPTFKVRLPSPHYERTIRADFLQVEETGVRT